MMQWHCWVSTCYGPNTQNLVYLHLCEISIASRIKFWLLSWGSNLFTNQLMFPLNLLCHHAFPFYAHSLHSLFLWVFPCLGPSTWNALAVQFHMSDLFFFQNISLPFFFLVKNNLSMPFYDMCFTLGLVI
jgi:hypothetical protein